MTNSIETNVAASDGDSEHMVVGSTNGKGYLTGPGVFEMPVNYTVEDGHAFCEGCIELGDADEVEADAERINQRKNHDRSLDASGDLVVESDDNEQKGVGIGTDSSFLWTNGVLVYRIASDVPDKGRVDDAIRHIEDNTAIRFVERTSSNASSYPNYVEIVSNGNKGWSSSKIGMRGGKQPLRFSDRHSWKILVHEFGHALGLYHEQSRSDRDEYVEIKWSNIPDGPPPEDEEDWSGNFKMKSNAVDYHDYDYDSIMHYGPKNFARDRSKPTIVPLKSGVTIGQREGLSYGDRLALAKMYQRFFRRGYAGVWRPGTGRYAVWMNASWSSFEDKWQQWSAQGLRLHDMHVRRVGTRTLYSGIFLPGSGRHALWANVSWTSFKDKWQQWSSEGLRLVDLHVHRSGGKNRYSGVFQQGGGAHGLWVNASWTSFKNKRQELAGRNLRLTDIHVHRVNGENRYSGVFRPGNSGHGLWANASWSSFSAKWKQWSSRGLRLVDLNMHEVNGSIRYTGAFLPGNDAHALWANVTYESLKAKWQQLAEKNMRLVDIEFVNSGDGAADQADFALADFAGEIADDQLQPFGGLFDPESVATELAPEREDTAVIGDGGGGILEAEPTDLRLAGDSSDGGTFFPEEVSGLVDELIGGDRGYGGAVFDESTSELVADQREDSTASGGVVFPEDATV